MKNPKTPILNEMTRKQINSHLQALKDLLNRAKNGTLNFDNLPKELGICFHWKKEMEKQRNSDHTIYTYTYAIVRELAVDWPETTSPGVQSAFPVPKCLSIWKGAGLRLRISLMRYIIKRLRDRLRRMP